jgi:tetratricopeptide (TPR) repeat protein
MVMKRSSRWLFFYLAAVAASLTSAAAFGQMRVGGDGHAMDANPETSSGGYNPTNTSPEVTGNDITYGNVTNGFAFRGRLPFSDPSGFGQVLPGEQVDAFVRDSTGVPTMSNSTVSNPAYAGPQVFYSKTQSPTIPDGFVPSPTASGNYLAAPAPTQADLSVDLRLGAPLDFNSPLPKPGELLLPGQVDASASVNPANPTPPTYFMASPLYGVRQVGTGLNAPTNPSFAAATPDTNNPNPTTSGQSTSPFGTMNRPNAQQQQIIQMRKELNQSAAQTGQASASDSQDVAPKPLQPLTPGSGTPGSNSQNPNEPLTPLQLASATPIQPTSLTPVAGDVSTAPLNSPEIQALLPPPAQQSTQIAELQRRMGQYNQDHPATAEEAQRQFLADLQARQSGAAGSDQTGMGTTPEAGNEAGGTGSVTGTQTPMVTPTPELSSAPPPTPMEIKSLAAGISSKSLADLLGGAEAQTTKGEYAKAIEAYDEAGAVAPNNALIPIGRAHAELGGSYYRQAELDLRAAFKMDSSVLLAQYDLQKLLGPQRLQYVVTDLKHLASDSPQNPTPVFLLAYIAYNTHHEDKAEGWLDVADRRSGGDDDVIPLLKKYWTFTSSTPATQP